DPDVKRGPDAQIVPGATLTLIGMVRPAPPVEEAIAGWMIDRATAEALVKRGTYLHAIEVKR
ncbi:MAG: hypothetical protein H7066_08855, partial [Cytophagaceae bacterium]|nr:hypothetical protein [Gemmatimonadaceae bacterium]